MIRNFLFSIFFYLEIILISIIFLPSLFLPKKIVLFGLISTLRPILIQHAFDNYIASVNKICEEKNSNSLLILENSAHQGTEIGYSIDHLARIYDGITEENRAKIGFCLDTCHAFAAGYNFCEEDGVTGFFEEFEEKIGLEKVVCIHLNDSKKKCNSCVDRHERLGVGMIGLDGIKYILNIIAFINRKFSFL